MEIKRLSHEGRGIAHYPDGKMIFIRDALPDEAVEFAVKKKHRQYDEGVATEILKASPLRVIPKCEAFGRCGGCALQHLDAYAQILAKEGWLREKLIQAKVEPQSWLAPLQAEVWGYRHKARLGVRFVRKKEKTLVGFRELESNYLSDVERCEVLHPSIGTHLDALKLRLDGLSNRESIAQIEVAADGVRTALVIRHLTPFIAEDEPILKALHDDFGWIIFLQPGGMHTIHQVYPVEKVDLHYSVPLKAGRAEIHFAPGDFTQVNFSVNEKMIEQALALMDLKGGETVLDLFAGLGNFTLPIASHAAKVLAVEGEAVMVNRARENAEKQGFGQIEFFAANLFELKDHEPFYTKVDQLFLDPPRAGAEAVVRNIEHWKPKKILYVSCDSSSFVRDLAILVHEKGYILKQVGVMDMFPHTAHCESMALLER